MDKTQQALNSFRKPYNCSQTIFAAYGNGDESRLLDLKNFGGGRAPDNMCGALYCALSLITAEKRDAATAKFAELAGSTKCREIKGVHKTPCETCVKIACDIVRDNS